MYYTEPYEGSKVQLKFETIYCNPYIRNIPSESTAVCPETEIDVMNKLQNQFSVIYIWWLSVDNYYGSGKIQTGMLRSIYRRYKHNKNLKLFGKSRHLVQSQYASDYLRNELKISESIERLSDYLNLDYIENVNVDLQKKENCILYNPKKGIEFTTKLMAAIPEYRWIALEGFSNIEMKKTMAKSKLYIDFGNHPGKDRIPREAAINYCCVITGMRGAAANDIDIPIKKMYKFYDNEDNIPLIHEMVRHCMDDYYSLIDDFKAYREKILLEPKLFVEDLCKIFGSKDLLE